MAQPGAGSPRNADSSSSTEAARAGTFSLRGHSLPLDSRVHAHRRDIADVALAGQVIASHYAAPLERACGSRATLVWPEAAAEGDPVSELLPGEGFAVLEYTGPWAWGYCTADHRVGYVEAIELVAPFPATHVVCELKVPVFADGSIGAAQLATMPMGSRLAGHESGACFLSEIGCVPMSHVRRLADLECDPAGIAMRLMHVPWRAGGRSHAGIDAAGLIQLAIAPCGFPVPRDLDMQRDLGAPVSGKLRRGDIVIAGDGDAMEGGVMIDDLMLIHASKAAGKVTVEPAAVLEARHGGGVRRRV